MRNSDKISPFRSISGKGRDCSDRIQIGHNTWANDLLHKLILITHTQCSTVQDSLRTPPSQVLWRLLTPIFVCTMSPNLNIRAAIPDNSDIILDPACLHRRQVHLWTIELTISNWSLCVLLLLTPARECDVDGCDIESARCSALEGLHEGPAPNILDVGVHVQDIGR